MKQQNRYAAGRKVYGGGRSNPTSGTVNPSGYIERAVNKKASDRRSGLAAAALRRTGVAKLGPWKSSALGQNMPPAGAQPVSTPTGQNYAMEEPQILPGFRGVGDPNNGYATGGPVVNDPNTGLSGHVSNDLAQQQQAAANWQPPVDPEAEAQAAAYEAERQRYLVDLMGQENDYRSAAGRRIRDLQTQQPRAREELLNNFASRGMGRSGRHLMDRADLDNRYAQQITGENEDLTRRLSEISQARGFKNSEIEALLNKNRAQSARLNAGNPAFQAPVAPILSVNRGSEDAAYIEAIKRRLAGA